MDYKEFSSKVKAKYPGKYDDFSDEDLARKLVQKYPNQYADVSFDSSSEAPPEKSSSPDYKNIIPQLIANGPGIGAIEAIPLMRNKIAPYLPAAGATIGGLVASPASLIPGVGTAVRSGAAGLGAGAGEALKQLIERTTGGNAPQTSGEAASQIGKQAGIAAATEAVIPNAVKYSGKALKPLAPVAAKGAAKVGEVLTNVPERFFRRLANDPGALVIPRTLKQAGERFGDVLKKEGIDLTPTPQEINDPQLSTARKNVINFYDKLKNGIKTKFEVPELKVNEVPVKVGKDFNPIQVTQTDVADPFSINAKASLANVPPSKLVASVEKKKVVGKYQPTAPEIMKAKRATDRIISATSWKDKNTLKNLYNQKNELNDLLENVSGPAEKASKEYSRSVLASQFRKVLPETQTGKISYVRSILAPLLFRSAMTPLTAGLTSPIVAGAITALGSVAAKGASSQAGRRAIAQLLASSYKNDKKHKGE